MELKPCPFCGGSAQIISFPKNSGFPQYEAGTPAMVGCPRCGARITILEHHEGALDIAVKAWNTRKDGEDAGE